MRQKTASLKTPNPNKNNLTLFADASIHPELKKAGWGFWIIGDNRNSMQAGGPMTTFTNNTTLAELMAIENGLACAESACYFNQHDKKIMLQSDSIGALAAIRYMRKSIEISQHKDGMPIHERKKPLDEQTFICVSNILDILDRCGLVAVVRHVRGHQLGGGRNWVNRTVDQLAKDGMRNTIPKVDHKRHKHEQETRKGELL